MCHTAATTAASYTDGVHRFVWGLLSPQRLRKASRADGGNQWYEHVGPGGQRGIQRVLLGLLLSSVFPYCTLTHWSRLTSPLLLYAVFALSPPAYSHLTGMSSAPSLFPPLKTPACPIISMSTSPLKPQLYPNNQSTDENLHRK